MGTRAVAMRRHPAILANAPGPNGPRVGLGAPPTGLMAARWCRKAFKGALRALEGLRTVFMRALCAEPETGTLRGKTSALCLS